MRALFLLGLATLVLSAGALRAQDTLDDVKRQLKIAADKLEADVREGLADAEKAAKKSVKEAIDLLDGLQVTLQISKAVSPERKKELQTLVDSRIRFYQQLRSRGDNRYDLEERMRAQEERARQYEQKQAEMRQSAMQMAELYRQGKFAEAAQLSRQQQEKYGRSPSTLPVARMADFRRNLDELKGLRDEQAIRTSRAMASIIRSSMPLKNPDSGIDFPDNWRELTKKRTEVKLTPEEKKLLNALRTPITTELKGQPLMGVLEEFERRYGIKYTIDKAATDQLMINSETQVNVRARNTSLRTVVKQMLGDVGLTYVILKGELYITTPERASQMMAVRAYYVGDLVSGLGVAFDPFGTSQLQAVQSIAAIIQMIQGIEPQSWQSGGGQGTIVFHPPSMSLLIKQSAEMHFMLQSGLR